MLLPMGFERPFLPVTRSLSSLVHFDGMPLLRQADASREVER
jgi:hypothetical protein